MLFVCNVLYKMQNGCTADFFWMQLKCLTFEVYSVSLESGKNVGLWEHTTEDKANFSRWSGKLSRKGCPAGRQVLWAEHNREEVETKPPTSSTFFCLFCAFLLSVCLQLCNYTSCLDLVVFFLFLSPSASPSPLFDLPLPLEILLMSPLHPRRCSFPFRTLYTCGPPQPHCSLTWMWNCGS